MVKSITYSIAIAILTLFLSGCNPYRFTVETKEPVACRIFSDHNTVKSNLYGFQMQPNAVVQMTSLSRTQYELTTYLTLSRGEGFRILLRPVVEESVVDSGLMLTFFSSGGTRLDSGGHMIEQNPSFRFPTDSQTFVTVYNEEAYLQVTVGCDTVLKHHSLGKSSDDVVLQTLPGSELKVVGPEWVRVKFVRNADVSVQ